MTYLTPSDTAMYRKGIHSSSTVWSELRDSMLVRFLFCKSIDMQNREKKVCVLVR